MPYVDIVMDKARDKNQFFNNNKQLFLHFLNFVEHRFTDNNYIKYVHRDFKPSKLAYTED